MMVNFATEQWVIMLDQSKILLKGLCSAYEALWRSYARLTRQNVSKPKLGGRTIKHGFDMLWNLGGCV